MKKLVPILLALTLCVSYSINTKIYNVQTTSPKYTAIALENCPCPKDSDFPLGGGDA
ncbi:MAG: hypothetical protein UGF43_13480 [Blautia sp.]|uniref:hypothetical protein n=1 Tax=Blautia sp. TaxID=1955243 RepID=UPI002E7A7A5E|nr:hypothetical protein [Blautia sp.]MEE1444604.1 hypothetical protein [Blautia sp.]